MAKILSTKLFFFFLNLFQDYIMEDREPGEIRARDPMAVLLSRIQSYRPPVDKSGSERDEISGHLHMYSNDEEISLEREPGEIGRCLGTFRFRLITT